MGPSILVRAGLVLASLMLFGSIPSFAEPFLVSDPYPKGQNQPTQFDVVCGELKFSVPPESLADGGKRLRLDLSRLPDGDLSLEIKAVNGSFRRESKPVTIHLRKNGRDVILLPAAIEPPLSQMPPPVPREKQKIPPSRTFSDHLNGPN